MKMVFPVFIPTLLIVGVSLIWYVRIFSTIPIDIITQNYTSYQALKEIMGTWYTIFLASITIYIIMCIYSECVVMGTIGEGLSHHKISLDAGAKMGIYGFLYSLLPNIILFGALYYLVTAYGKYYLVVPLFLAFLFNYATVSSVVDKKTPGKNIFSSISLVAKSPPFSIIFFIIPLVVVFIPTLVAFLISLETVPHLTLIITSLVAMFFIPFSAILKTVAYLSLRS
ncbi:MAG: hypothetical protein ACXQTP_03380 [Candidatus Methanofastidiosia archaeon]